LATTNTGGFDMKTFLAAFILMLSFSATADELKITFEGGSLTCNWGELTADYSENMGEHSSDPSGDGRGPGDADSPRGGLANVVNKGDLAATCEFIRSMLGG
jgi:hypothetical protein